MSEPTRRCPIEHTRQNSWWLLDAKGIELCRVCEHCEQAAVASYPDEVMGFAGEYTDVVDEVIEPEDY